MAIDTEQWEPNSAIRWLVDRYHVGTPYRKVRDDINKRIRSPTPTLVRRHAIRDAMRVHYMNRRLYAAVMGGRL